VQKAAQQAERERREREQRAKEEAEAAGTQVYLVYWYKSTNTDVLLQRRQPLLQRRPSWQKRAPPMGVCLCVCVCERERERETGRQQQQQLACCLFVSTCLKRP
jgi:hypothetical protein